MMKHLFLRDLLARELSSPHDWLPDIDVPGLIRPRQRPAELPGTGRTAAVLLLLYPDRESQTRLVLTQRPGHLNHHAGQVSLPGGQQEPGEALPDTALREAWEELGVDRSQIDLLGALNTVYIPPSDFLVHPFVGWLPQLPIWRPEPMEVEEVIEVTLTQLMDPSTRRVADITVASGQCLPVPCYAIAQHLVWGATALILAELIQRLRSIQSL